MLEINPSLMKELFEYDPSAGESCLRWKSTTRHTKANALAGSVTDQNYYVISIKHKHYRAHRVIWAIVHGVDPRHQIDHINGDTTDNRIENLRLCVNGQKDNQQNSKIRRTNTSGVNGVYWNKVSQKWRPYITVNYKRYYLGEYETLQAAKYAREKAKQQLHTFQPIQRTA